VKGFSEVKSKLQKIPNKMQDSGVEGLREVGKQIFDSSQAQVPVDTGALRSSATMTESGGKNLTITIAYNADYALYVHEKLGNVHPHGNAKYLENPFNQYAPTLEKVVQSKIGDIT